MIKFDNDILQPFTLVLCHRNYEPLGILANTQSLKITENLNAVNEISFTLYKMIDEYEDPLWNEVYELRLVYIPEINEYFEITLSHTQSLINTKEILGKSLCEAELSQNLLYGVEINTENDIDANGGSYFYYPEDPKRSILHRVLSSAPAYTISYVDSDLAYPSNRNIPEYNLNGKDIYGFLIGDLAETYNCLFEFDSTNRSISVKSLYSRCLNTNCNHLGNFYDVCPKCGGTKIKYPSVGKDTTIFVSTGNLTEKVMFETDTDSIKNCFHLKGADDDINAAIKNINPNGSAYIYQFSDENLNDMPKNLVDGLTNYSSLYNTYYSKNYSVDSTARNNYNALVDKYKDLYKSTNKDTLQYIPEVISGYPNLVSYIYIALDFYYYLRSRMMPVAPMNIVDPNETVAQTQAKRLKAISNSDNNTLVMSSLTNYTSAATVESSLKNYAKIFVATGYVKIDVETTSYTQGAFLWEGRFKITNYSDEDDVWYVGANLSQTPYGASYMTLNLSNSKTDFLRFYQQTIKKQLKQDDDEYYDILSPEMPYGNFKIELKKYGFKRLESIRDACSAVLSILQQAGVTDANNIDTKLKDLYNRYYTNGQLRVDADGNEYIDISSVPDSSLGYYEKMLACEDELQVRSGEMNVVYGDLTNKGMYYHICDMMAEVQETLNMPNYLNRIEDGLYDLLTTYLRMDEYSNSNYISTDLNTNELFMRAEQFIQKAKEELDKSSHYQHSISANLYNIIALEEFAPLIDNFELGNWIRVGVDDNVYRLRLISYSIDFDDLRYIDTQFSDVTQSTSGFNDINSILTQASNIASSYSYTQSKVTETNNKVVSINQMIDDGLNSALTNISNNTNEDVLINQSGITLRTWNYDKNTYDGKQVRLTHNILCFTDNNWATVSTALGMHTYTKYDPSQKGFIQSEGYGLTAKFVQAGYIVNGSMIGGDIYSSNYSQTNKTGTHIDLTNGNMEIYFANGGNKFSIDDSGNVDIAGKITATSGFIGTGNTAFNIGSFNNQVGAIWSNNNSGIASGGVYVGTDGINVMTDSTKGFYAKADGTVYIGNSNHNIRYDGNTTVSLKGVNLTWTDASGGTNTQTIEDMANSFSSKDQLLDAEDALLHTDIKNLDEKTTQNLNNTVDKYLKNGGKTAITDDFIISPYIGGGYLYLTGTNNGKSGSLLINPGNFNDSAQSLSQKIIEAKYDGDTIFSVDFGGSANFKGKIESSSGKIANWDITNDWLCSNSNNTGVGFIGKNDSAYQNIAVWAGSPTGNNWLGKNNPFYVTYDGFLHASNADISGKITSSQGQIAGWTLDSLGFYKDSVLEIPQPDGSVTETTYRTGVAVPDKSVNDYAFWAGDRSNPGFIVLHNGNLFAKNADIAGKITATSGSVGGFNITNTFLYGNNGILGCGMSIDPTLLYYENNSPLAIWAGRDNTHWGDSPFIVTQDGSVFASKGVIGGWNVNSFGLYKDTVINKVQKDGSTVQVTYRTGMQRPSSIYDWAFRAGDVNNAAFLVDHQGNVTAHNITATGTINALNGCLSNGLRIIGTEYNLGGYIEHLAVGSISAASIDAGQIKTGTIDTARLSADVVTTETLTTNVVNAGFIKTTKLYGEIASWKSGVQAKRVEIPSKESSASDYSFQATDSAVNIFGRTCMWETIGGKTYLVTDDPLPTQALAE